MPNIPTMTPADHAQMARRLDTDAARYGTHARDEGEHIRALLTAVRALTHATLAAGGCSTGDNA